jgi:hypothetical protein
MPASGPCASINCRLVSSGWSVRRRLDGDVPRRADARSAEAANASCSPNRGLMSALPAKAVN